MSARSLYNPDSFEDSTVNSFRGTDRMVDEALEDFGEVGYDIDLSEGQVTFYDDSRDFKEAAESAFTVNMVPHGKEDALFVYHDDRDIDLPSRDSSDMVGEDAFRLLEEGRVYGPEEAEDYSEGVEDVIGDETEIQSYNKTGYRMVPARDHSRAVDGEVFVWSDTCYNLEDWR